MKELLKNNTTPILTLTILILINIASSYYFTRIDLTNDKRYSISKETRNLIKEIDDIIYFKIYLHGNIPMEYKNLSKEVKHMLNELRAYSKYIQYDFIDPSSLENDEYKRALQEELYKKGITPVPHRSYENNKLEETWIFPGITVSYKTKEVSLPLINESLMHDPETVIKQSIDRLEYSLINSIRRLIIKKKRIGLINGHGEITNKLIESFKELVSTNYHIIDIPPINGQLNALNEIDCIIINHPKDFFTEKDKFIIDQFIMNGGKSIWILGGTNANMDSLTKKNETLVMPLEKRNLNDLLFKYGIRVNNNLIQDLQAAPIPIVTHYIDDKPQWTFFPWTFFPILSTTPNHIITTNINPIKSQFPSSIDTISNHIEKTILLKTTKNTKITRTPALINLESLKTEPDALTFNNNEQNIAVLLTGLFKSVFQDRIPLSIQEDPNINFIESSANHNKMLVISDGYFLNNQFFKGQTLPLGFDKHTGKQYGNGDFILNCIDYLLGDEIFIKIRSKNTDLRLLNTQKIKTEQKYWQILNILMPLVFILIIGLALFMIRKKKHT